jgi:hypothetical protein
MSRTPVGAKMASQNAGTDPANRRRAVKMKRLFFI